MSAVEPITFYLRASEHGWLSNFYRSPQTVAGVTYQTNEHYYQAQKAGTRFVAEWIAAAPSPFLAMKAGRALRPAEMVPDWLYRKERVMLTGLRAKFFQNDALADLLLATGDAPIHEDSPTDMVWGRKGADLLGILLGKVRQELREGRG